MNDNAEDPTTYKNYNVSWPIRFKITWPKIQSRFNIWKLIHAIHLKNIIKKKPHRIISEDTRKKKAWDKIQIPVKKLRKLEIEFFKNNYS